MGLKDKKKALRTITGRDHLYILLGIIGFLIFLVVAFISFAWVYGLTEFVVTINLTADEPIERMIDLAENQTGYGDASPVEERIELYYELGDNETILYHEDGDYQSGWGVLDEPTQT